MGREGRAADNWGASPSSRSVEMILLSETERWGVWSFRARGAPGDWAGVVTRVHALTSRRYITRGAQRCHPRRPDPPPSGGLTDDDARGSATHETHQSLGTTTEKMNDALKNAKHASLATIRDVIKSVDGNVTSDAARYNDKLAHAHAARADAVLDAYEASKRTVSLFSFAYGQLV